MSALFDAHSLGFEAASAYITPHTKGDEPRDSCGFEFHNFCGQVGTVLPVARYATGPFAAVVVNVTTLSSTNDQFPLRLFLSSCTGNASYRVTRPGVFTVPGNGVVAFFQRAPIPNANSSKCEGEAPIQFTAETIESHCEKNGTRPDCATITATSQPVPTPAPSVSAATPSVKRSGLFAVVSVCLPLAVALL